MDHQLGIPVQNPQPQVDVNNMAPGLSSMASFQSVQSVPSHHEDERIEGQQDLQIVQSRHDRRINQEEIVRMFNEQLQKQERQKQEIELKRRQSLKSKPKNSQKPNQKKASHQEKKSNKQNNTEKLQALNERSVRIRKRIEQFCKEYKSMYRPSIYDTKVQRFRFQYKQKLFFYLCFGVQEMRELIEELNQQEKRILETKTYEICRKLAFQIDLQMLRILNKGDRYEVSRQYKLQFENLLNNLRDQNNSELKKRIITKTFQPSRIAIASQIEFFTLAKREEILEKQKKYIAQFTVDNVLMPFDQRNDEIEERQQPEVEPQREEIPTLKSQKSGLSNKYIDEASILQIQELISNNQLQKMLNRLEEDLQGRSKTLLMANFKEVFNI